VVDADDKLTEVVAHVIVCDAPIVTFGETVSINTSTSAFEIQPFCGSFTFTWYNPGTDTPVTTGNRLAKPLGPDQ
jgi:hypothetical protein